MKPHHAKDIVRRLLIANFTLIFILMFLGAGNAKPLKSQRTPFPGGKSGQEAITALKERLPKVASRYGKSQNNLKKQFLQDKDLWLDPADNLLYLCSLDASEAGIQPEPADAAIPTVPLPLDQTFLLHSLPGATRIIYLDFDGHVTSGSLWNNFNGGADIVSLPYDFDGNTGSFSDSELTRIQKIWARVTEDFAIYNIDVTTEDPGIEALRNSGSGDQLYGVRVVISPSSSWYGSAGGVAYVGSFDWNSDTPTFVFSNKLGNGSEKYVTDATAHETGHTLGLSHDGTTSGTSYYAGHGNWAPIMGVGYYEPITQWSKGEYAGANNTEDDLAVMLNNGASYKQDDHGDWIDSATMFSGDILDASGIIERTGDMDVFGFQTEAGDISINIDPASLDPNLDIFFQILDDGGNIINQDDPYYILPASLNLNLPAGTYYILIDGAGTGDQDTGYSDYASLGQYFISGTLPTTQFPPVAPANLSVMPASSSEMHLSWTDSSTNENGFSIERSPNGVDTWVELGFAIANTTTYTDAGLTQITTYHYRVSAYNVIGNSDYSNSASATTFDLPPASPSNLNATAVVPGQIGLDWADNSSNENGFAIERSPNGVNSWVEIATVTDNITNYTDTGLASGTTFFYRVAAYNLNGNSDFSNSASGTTAETPPESPTNLDAVASSSTQIDLSWQDISSNETGFKVERSPDGFEPWTEIAALANNSTGYSDNSVSPGTTYYYRVFSYNSAGASGSSNIAVATTDEPPQFIDQTSSQEAAIAGSVSGTYIETHANDSVVEILTEQTSGGRPSKRYSYLEHRWTIQIQPGTSMTLFANAWAPISAEGDTFAFSYSTDNVNYNDMFTVSTDFDDDTYHIYPLPGNLSGTVYIRVTDTLRSAGSYDKDTLYLDHLFIRTDNEPGSLPLSPSSLAATGISSDAITLNWTDNADNDLGFFIERSSDAISWEKVGSTGPDAVTFTDTGLPPGETFYYQVQAFNSSGVSSYTDVADATTAQAATMSVGSMDQWAEPNRSRWNGFVTITVHDPNGAPVVGATVEGSWDIGGSSSAVTDGNGQCTVSKSRIKTSIPSTTFSVTGLVKNGFIYNLANNALSSIVVLKP